MKPSRPAATVLVIGALLSAASAAAAQGVTLKYQWRQGDALIYRTTLRSSSTMTGMPNTPGPVSLEQTMTQTIKMLVAAVGPDGTATIQQSFESVKVEFATPMGKVSYDSAVPATARDEASEMLQAMFGGIIGSTITVVMTPTGKVQRIAGVPQLLEKLSAALPRDARAAQLAQGLKSMLSEDALRAALEQSFSQMAPKDVKPGDTWNGQVSLGNPAVGRIAGHQTFTLKSVEADVAKIGVALAMTQESAPPIGPAGMTMKLGESKGEGEIEFDVAKGRIRKATMTAEMPTTMTAPGPDGQTATVRNTTKTSMTMELVEK